MRRAELVKAIDGAILRGLRLYRENGRLVRCGRELLSIKPKFDLNKCGWYLPVTAEIREQPDISNN
jgi:hypothetical protein